LDPDFCGGGFFEGIFNEVILFGKEISWRYTSSRKGQTSSGDKPTA
jgi:hypothetical protein